MNGPRWTPELQLPALSRVRKWNHHEPSASAPLVAVVAVVSSVASGEVDELCDHSIEKPETPLPASAAPLHATSTTRTADQSEACVLESAGSAGAAESILNGPMWIGALQLPALSRVRKWNHHEPSARAALVADEPVVSFAWSGVVPGLCDHSNE